MPGKTPGFEMLPKVILIISGGPVADLGSLRQRIVEAGPAELICADGGARHVLALGLMPDVVIGDMDSLPQERLKTLQEGGCRIMQYPARKDETDTELALQYALAQKPDAVEIYGALGERIDHTLANISLLVSAERMGIKTRLVDGPTVLFLVSTKAEVQGMPGEVVSFFPVTTNVSGITLRGFEYPLQEAKMEIGKPYGVSNRLLGIKGEVSVSQGLLLVVKMGEVEAQSIGEKT